MPGMIRKPLACKVQMLPCGRQRGPSLSHRRLVDPQPVMLETVRLYRPNVQYFRVVGYWTKPASSRASRRPRSGYTTTSSPSRSPTSAPALLARSDGTDVANFVLT